MDFFRDVHNRVILFRVGNFLFLTYGLISAIAWIISIEMSNIYVLMKSDQSCMSYLLYCALPLGFLGARLMSCIMEDGILMLLFNPAKALLRPGLWLYGAIIALVVSTLFIAPYFSLSRLVLLDGILLSSVLYDSISRLACHTLGCCFGRVAEENEFGICYHNPNSLVCKLRPDLCGKKLIPAQLYGFVIYLVIYLFLFFACTFFHFEPGFATGVTLLVHYVGRLLHECMRRDNRIFVTSIGGVLNLTMTKIIGVGLAVGGLVFGIYCQKYPETFEKDVGGTYRRFEEYDWTAIFHVGVLESRFKLLVAFVISFCFFGIHYKEVGTYLPREEKEK